MSLPILRESADVVRIFHPDTGEELVLSDAETGTLALWLAACREYEENLRMAKRVISQEVIHRMDKGVRWTLREGGYELSAPSPAPGVEYDGEALHQALSELLAAELITVDALDEAVVPVETFKVKPAGVKRLLKLGGPVAAAVAACGREVERQRRVSVKHA